MTTTTMTTTKTTTTTEISLDVLCDYLDNVQAFMNDEGAIYRIGTPYYHMLHDEYLSIPVPFGTITVSRAFVSGKDLILQGPDGRKRTVQMLSVATPII